MIEPFDRRLRRRAGAPCLGCRRCTGCRGSASGGPGARSAAGRRRGDHSRAAGVAAGDRQRSWSRRRLQAVAGRRRRQRLWLRPAALHRFRGDLLELVRDELTGGRLIRHVGNALSNQSAIWPMTAPSFQVRMPASGCGMCTLSQLFRRSARSTVRLSRSRRSCPKSCTSRRYCARAVSRSTCRAGAYGRAAVACSCDALFVAQPRRRQRARLISAMIVVVRRLRLRLLAPARRRVRRQAPRRTPRGFGLRRVVVAVGSRVWTCW